LGQRFRIALALSLGRSAQSGSPFALCRPIWATLFDMGSLADRRVLIALYQLDSATPAWIARLGRSALYAGWLSAASFVSIGLLLAGYWRSSGGNCSGASFAQSWAPASQAFNAFASNHGPSAILLCLGIFRPLPGQYRLLRYSGDCGDGSRRLFILGLTALPKKSSRLEGAVSYPASRHS